MRKKRFVPPNFKGRVVPQQLGAPAFDQLEHGDSQQAVLARLIEQYPGAQVTVEPYDFEAWRQKARAETARSIAAHQAEQAYEFKDEIWGALKDYLFRLFDRKCAYCESTRAAVTKGSVEHYRPKGAVRGTKHSGYYWLAYDPENYLPACPPCNTYKSSHFPLADESKRVSAPPADPFDQTPFKAEQPLLLNPLHEDPYPRSLTFDVLPGQDGAPRFIFAKPLDVRAERSIALLQLNRTDLAEERAQESAHVLRKFLLEFTQAGGQTIDDLVKGRLRYSAACWAALETALKRQLQMLTPPPEVAHGR